MKVHCRSENQRGRRVRLSVEASQKLLLYEGREESAMKRCRWQGIWCIELLVRFMFDDHNAACGCSHARSSFRLPGPHAESISMARGAAFCALLSGTGSALPLDV